MKLMWWRWEAESTGNGYIKLYVKINWGWKNILIERIAFLFCCINGPWLYIHTGLYGN